MSGNEILSPAANAVKGVLQTNNPWARLGIVLRRVFDRVLDNISGSEKITGEELDEIFAEWKSCEFEIRATCVPAGIPFEVFDPLLTDVGRQIRTMIGMMNGSNMDFPGVDIPATISRIGQLGITWQGAQPPAPAPTIVHSASPAPAADSDGPKGGRIWWGGQPFKIAATRTYQLIAHMWSRSTSGYDELCDEVFGRSVLPGTIRGAASRANLELSKIGVPWRLTADSELRLLSKEGS